MQKEVEEMRRMFDVDEGSWRDGTFWRKERTDIRVGLMRYRVHLWGAGRMIHGALYPIFNCRVIRRARLNETTEAQKNVNWRNSRERLILLAETNFTEEKDSFLTLTYAGAIPDFDRCYKDISNYIRKLRRYFRKCGVELKYIYSITDTPDKQIHIHLVINGIWDASILQSKWKHGNLDVEKLDNTNQALSGIAKYLYEQNGKRNKEWLGRHMWNCSENLDEPVERVSDSKVNNRQVKLLVADVKNNGKEIFARLYKGYYLVGIPEVKTSSYVDGVYIKFILCSLNPTHRLCKKKTKNKKRGKRKIKNSR